MKKIILSLLLLVAFVNNSKAQDYNWAIGVRGGVNTSGVTVKYSLDGVNAIEGIVSFMNGVNLYGMYERYMPVIDQGFNFYYGAGANIGSWKHSHSNKFTVGINGIIGLEYKINSIPLALSLDYKPGFNIIGKAGFKSWGDIGLGVKVTF